MTKAEIIQFLNANPTCYLATAQNNQPFVRAMRMVRADEQGIIFQTVDGKDLPKQMSANPHVEVCFYNMEQNVQVRVSGKAVPVDDLELKKSILEERAFLKPVVEQKGFGVMLVFRMVDCAAYMWSRERNLLPKEYVNW